MDSARLRAWWFHRQGLDGSLKNSSIADSLTRCGWARSVGGSSPYLGFFARLGARRQAVDDAVAKVEIHELPAARGCTYIVPAADYPLALRIAGSLPDSEMKVAQKLGVTDDEVYRLGVAIMDVLRDGASLDPDGLKQVLGTQVRSLGEEGRKKGLATTLPLALGSVQVQGQIRRVPINGRLDQQRYRYQLWEPTPFNTAPPATEPVHTTLARRYFDWTAPATLSEFQWFSGLGVKAAKAAIDPLQLVEIEANRLLPANLAAAFAAFKTPKNPQYALVGSIDGMFLLRRDLKSLTADEDLHSLVQGDKGGVELGSVADLPSHAILDRGRIIGLWEYDPTTESIAWATFGKADAAVTQAVKEMEQFVKTDLGDVRSFSLDSPKSRAPRIAALRAS